MWKRASKPERSLTRDSIYKNLALFFTILILLAHTPSKADMIDAKSVPTWEHCAMCHGLYGNSRNPRFPKLAGQSFDYIMKQLENFKSGARKNDRGQMQGIVDQFSRKELEEAANWFSSQTPKLYKEIQPNSFDFISEFPKISLAASKCTSCHNKTTTQAPLVDGQHKRYLMKQIRDHFKGTRKLPCFD